MANPEHLAILKQGVDAWNEWRKKTPKVQPDLSGANLERASLAGIQLKGSNLTGVTLVEADLSRADFIGDIVNRGVVGPDPGEFPSARLDGANLLGASLSGANLSFASCLGINLERAFVRASNLDRAYLANANLTGADLVGAILIEAKLNNAQLVGANLQWTDLTMANLVGADVSASMMGRTTLVDVDLSNVKGLDKVKHSIASFIGLDTIYRSGGKIPEVFLRGCGVPDDMIIYVLHEIGNGKAFEFYSAFISYSSKDDDFAKRLHADLQAQHVRVWFANEDMKIGDEIRPRIDEAIRIYDKLMVVLTEASIKSVWVKDEVEAALEKERRENRLVLFPIRLDEVVMQTDQAWAAMLRRQRHIGDFTKWKNHDDYQEAFDRLLRDLKTR